jgi:hypothetical protein
MRPLILALTLLTLALPAGACSVLTAVGDAGVFFGNNEDYFKPGYLWVTPARKGRLARVNFGFQDRFMQGGMNERGLCVDASALNAVPWDNRDGKKAVRNLIELAMERCGTVDEVLALFETHHCKHLGSGQFMFTDAGGDAVILTGLPDGRISAIRRTDGSLLMTNTRLEMSPYRCPRFVRAEQVLEAGPASLERVRDALAAIHQQGEASTVYSTIYEPKTRRIHIYHLADFSSARSFDFDTLLRDGPRDIALADLFQAPPEAFEALRKRPARVYDTRVDLSPEQLAEYTGQYRGDQTGRTGEVTADAGDLVLTNSDGAQLRVWPEGRDRFRMADGGQIIFGRESGTVRHLAVLAAGGIQTATRIN